MNKKLIKTSKFLSYVLRHKPEAIGLELDTQGWVEVDTLIEAAQQHGTPLDLALIQAVVASNDKQRFAWSEDGQRIRANQGHSIKVDLGLAAQEPPELLFHGTASRFMQQIQRQGLRPSGRHHVHLSADQETAFKVGTRHGMPVVLRIAAGQMFADGCVFYLSENGIWLTDQVAPQYFSILK